MRSLTGHCERVCLVLGIASMVGLVLLFTPLPDLEFASCDRPCHELDWPMICRFKLTLELHQVMGGWCGDCPRNTTHCFRPGCIIADGITRRVMSVNKQLPGPAIQVCERDILVVDVINKIPGQAATVHWRGQHQRESPHMDGVPMITQCPISTYTTFQYKFRASQAGTHLWHAHTGNELLDGLFGPLIVRRADRLEQQKHLYDADDPNHIIVLNEWGSPQPLAPNQADSSKILVNGIASNEVLMPKFNVTLNLRYRMRVIHAGGGQGCPLHLSVNHHTMLVIYLDGTAITPKGVSAIKLAQGERADFVLHANQEPGEYLIRVESNCTNSIGLAKIDYGVGYKKSAKTEHIHPKDESWNLLSTMTEEKCGKKSATAVCLSQVKALNSIPSSLSKSVDVKLYLPFDYINTAKNVRGIGDLTPRMNNITFMFPPSPILSQPYDLASDLICKAERKPKKCAGDALTCECVHVIDIPLNSKVELILIDKDVETAQEHVFHFHGQSFYVVGVAENLQGMTVEEIKSLDSKGLLMIRDLKNPVMKDTVTIPRRGAIALRFLANNPGYWLLHDQSAMQWASGLDVVFKVGEARDLPSAPDNFPQCGSWIGPDFFLI